MSGPYTADHDCIVRDSAGEVWWESHEGFTAFDMRDAANAAYLAGQEAERKRIVEWLRVRGFMGNRWADELELEGMKP